MDGEPSNLLTIFDQLRIIVHLIDNLFLSEKGILSKDINQKLVPLDRASLGIHIPLKYVSRFSEEVWVPFPFGVQIGDSGVAKVQHPAYLGQVYISLLLFTLEEEFGLLEEVESDDCSFSVVG